MFNRKFYFFLTLFWVIVCSIRLVVHWHEDNSLHILYGGGLTIMTVLFLHNLYQMKKEKSDAKYADLN